MGAVRARLLVVIESLGWDRNDGLAGTRPRRVQPRSSTLSRDSACTAACNFENSENPRGGHARNRVQRTRETEAEAEAEAEAETETETETEAETETETEAESEAEAEAESEAEI